MRKRKTLTPAIEKRITQDWAREFPGMGTYKKRWLMRRVGPLLVGICLDRDSHGDLYKPVFHVFFLGRHWDAQAPALTLYTPLRTARTNAPDDVEVRQHEEKYLDAVERMKKQALLPLDGPLTVDQVIRAYHEYHRKQPMGYRTLTHNVVLMSDIIMLLAWCGRKAAAEKALHEVLDTVPEGQGYRYPYGTRAAFEQPMRQAIEQPATITRHVEHQIQRLGVEALPVSELRC